MRNLNIISASMTGKKGAERLILAVQLQQPKESDSGKSHILATESGVSTVKVADRDVIVNLNAIVMKDPTKCTGPLSQRTTAKLDGKILRIDTALLDAKPSGSGKSMVVAKDSGRTECKLGKNAINVTFSAYFYPTDKKPLAKAA